MKVEMEQLGHSASKARIARIMRAAGLRARPLKRFRATTDSKHNYPIAPNVLDRKFTVDRSNQVWVSDITYIRTYQGWLYLTVIIDLFDRKVIGWAMSNTLSAQSTIIEAWRMAVKNRKITQKLIFHSDRGVQYACKTFTNILRGYNELVTQSMSRKGNCWDNAVAESFFKTLKVEWVYNQRYQHKNQAQLSIFYWIETWYNRKRRHSALDYKTIEEFEQTNINLKQAA
jgi:transposase InsO family protein